MSSISVVGAEYDCRRGDKRRSTPSEPIPRIHDQFAAPHTHAGRSTGLARIEALISYMNDHDPKLFRLCATYPTQFYGGNLDTSITPRPSDVWIATRTSPSRPCEIANGQELVPYPRGELFTGSIGSC